MKNLKDIHNRLQAELDQWFVRQVRNPYEDYYLYYLPTNNKHDGGFLIAIDKPENSEYELVVKVRKDLTIEQNFHILEPILRKLPILSLS